MSLIEKAIGRMHTESINEKKHDVRPVGADNDHRLIEAIMHASSSRNSPRNDGRFTETKHFDIDLERLQQQGFLTPDTGRTPLAEEFRHVKRTLIENASRFGSLQGRHGNLLMVTSALPREGKTFCAINLAMSIAMELDHTVLLVDADVAQPAIPPVLGLQAENGLLDLLHDRQLDLKDLMYSTNVERLRILPAGRSHKRATELLASQAMDRLLDEIAGRYRDRFIIFDSPPILPTSEARALSKKMGQIVMVVEAESTTQHNVKTALQKLGNSANVSLLYNKAKSLSNHYIYGDYSDVR